LGGPLCRAVLSFKKPDAQRITTIKDREEMIDIRVRTGPVLRISRMFSKNLKAMCCRVGINDFKVSRKISINNQRSLLARLIFDGRDNDARRIKNFYTIKALNGRKKLQILFKRRGWLDHFDIPFLAAHL
jgi:hypothetical protein